METLNALLKKVITIFDGITYTPQVITTDNTKGEMVVEIEMQKGAVRATVNFTIAGFTTTSQVQVDLETALAKVGANTISGDGAQLPSSITAKLIGTLKGFPQTMANGVHFSAIPKIAIDAAGTLAITLRATKGELNKAKEITIRDFKTQSDQVTINKALAKVGANTISGDGAQLPSLMTTKLIGALKGFPQTMANGVHFSATPKTPNNAAGTLTITLMATKGSASEDKEFTIRGFQTQAQVDQVAVNVALVAIDETTISGDVDKLPSTMLLASIATLVNFPQTMESGVHFKAIALNDTNDTKGELIITLRAVKGSAKKDKAITISGFKTIDQVTIDTALIGIDSDTISGDADKLPSAMFLASIATLVNFPSTTASGVRFRATALNDANDIKGELIIILTAEKGSAKGDKAITISGFKTQAHVDVAIALEGIDNDTITGDKTKLPSAMNLSSIATLIGFPQTTASGVHFSVISKDKKNDTNGQLEIILRATKGSVTKDKELTISGFQTQAQANQIVVNAYKKLISGTTTTTTKVLNKLSSMVIYTDITDFNTKTNANLAQPDPGIKISITSQDNDGNKVVTFAIMKGTKRAMHDIKVTSFKTAAQQAQDDISAAKAILDNFENTTTINVFQTAAEVTTYASLWDLIAKTHLIFLGNEEDLVILRKVTIAITTIPVAKTPTSQIVTFTISKSGGSTATSTIIVAGFKTQVEVDQIDPNQIDVEAAIFNINSGTIKGDNNKLASKMTFKLVKALVGFPQDVNGISFSLYGDLGYDDSLGALNIFLRATKNFKTKTSVIPIFGFKKKG